MPHNHSHLSTRTQDCSLFSMAYTQPMLGGLFQGLNGYLHGPVHIMIGGQWFYDGADYSVSEVSRVYITCTSTRAIILLAGGNKHLKSMPHP